MYIFAIKQIREKKNYSIRTLSEKTELSHTYINDLENNKKLNPTLDILVKIANALEVNVKDLFYTRLDIEALRNKIHDSIDKNGLNAEETIKISQLLDLVLNIRDEWH